MKKPNRVLAPIVIAGITVGFLASAYKFVFASAKTKPAQVNQNKPTEEIKPLTEEQIDAAP